MGERSVTDRGLVRKAGTLVHDVTGVQWVRRRLCRERMDAIHGNTMRVVGGTGAGGGSSRR